MSVHVGSICQVPTRASRRSARSSRPQVSQPCSPFPSRSPAAQPPRPHQALTDAQRGALARAVCSQAEFRLTVGEGELVGGDEWIRAELRTVRTAGRVGPKVLEELAGSGLITWSGCAPAA